LPLLTDGARDLPARQRTLRSAIGWSYDLLSPEEQALFRRLGVFAGGFSVASARALATEGADGDEPPSGTPGGGVALSEQADVEARLEALVTKHLVCLAEARDGQPRFTLLETIREFALEQLTAHGEIDDVRRRHAAQMLALAEVAEPETYRSDQVRWFDHLEDEHDNVRAALRWYVDSGDALQGMRLAGALTKFWHVRWYRNEGRSWFAALLDLPCGGTRIGDMDESDSQARAADAGQLASRIRLKALLGAGLLAWMERDEDAAAATFAASFQLARRLRDRRSQAEAESGLGITALRRGDLARADDYLVASLAGFESAGDEWGTALGHEHLGQLRLRQGSGAAAYAHFERAVAICRRCGDLALLLTSLMGLAIAARHQGRAAEARGALEEAVSLGVALGYRIAVFGSMRLLVDLALQGGDLPYARARCQDAAGELQGGGVTPPRGLRQQGRRRLNGG
jgi:tetratricopeptide (TPR) repeat protein